MRVSTGRKEKKGQRSALLMMVDEEATTGREVDKGVTTATKKKRERERGRGLLSQNGSDR